MILRAGRFSLTIALVIAFSQQAHAQVSTVIASPEYDVKTGEKIQKSDGLWSVHFQATGVSQEHGGIHSPYGTNLSMGPEPESKTSFTSTLFLGRKLWKDGELFVNPELAAGSGLASTHGIAGYPNGEIYRVDSPSPKGNLSRLFLKQIFALSDEKEDIEPEQNVFAGAVPLDRFTVIAGKFSLNDVFDDNTYSHDPRTQFLNWSLMDNGAWDYAADTRGYTSGIFMELNHQNWALRFASVLEPKEANGLDLDSNILQANAENFEGEYRYQCHELNGKIRFLSFLNHAHMGLYGSPTNGGSNPDVTLSRQYRTKYGFGLNFEQELSASVGIFARAGWNDGKTETWTFTEVDRTISAGISVKGIHWNRKDDVFGLAFILNGLSSEHEAYLASGGQGFLIGDGKLNYSGEKIMEAYYLYQFLDWAGLTLDFQGVKNPGYNVDRGPIAILGSRLHVQF